MQNNIYFHESFNLRKLSSYLLNIQVSKEGICYVITDVIRNQYIAIKYQEFENSDEDILVNLQKAIKEDVYLNKHYKTVNFYFVSDKYTLVPAEFFDKKYLNQYFKYNQYLLPTEEIHFTLIAKPKVYNVFAYPAELTSFLVNHFPEVRLFHSTLPFVNYFLYLNENTTKEAETVGVNFYKSSFDIVVIKKQELLFLNSFKFKTEEDAIYFIMSVIDKLSLEKTKIELILQGNTNKQGKVYNYLKEMILKTKFSNKFTREYPFKEIPAYYFSNLLIDF